MNNPTHVSSSNVARSEINLSFPQLQEQVLCNELRAYPAIEHVPARREQLQVREYSLEREPFSPLPVYVCALAVNEECLVPGLTKDQCVTKPLDCDIKQTLEPLPVLG
jgi:hypothetical protein